MTKLMTLGKTVKLLIVCSTYFLFRRSVYPIKVSVYKLDLIVSHKLNYIL